MAWLIALAGLVGGCAVGGPGQSEDPDAATLPGGVDGPRQKIDGPRAKVDAPPGAPDAAPPDVDARPPVIDAAPDARPPEPDAPPPAECSPTFENLLVNASFEQGSGVGWVESGSNLIVVGDDFGFPAFDGARFAWLAGFDGASDTLSQDVHIPSGTTKLRLSFHVCHNQESGDNGTDFMKAQLQSQTGTVLQTLATFEDAGTGCGWEAFPPLNISPTREGQDLTLVFHAETDGQIFTSYRVDQVALEAACP